MQSKTRLFLAPLWVYIGLAVIAVFYAWYKSAYDPAHSEFAGLPLIILGLPWSFIWHNFNPKFVANEFNNSILVECIFIALNAVILVLVITTVYILRRRSRKA